MLKLPTGLVCRSVGSATWCAVCWRSWAVAAEPRLRSSPTAILARRVARKKAQARTLRRGQAKRDEATRRRGGDVRGSISERKEVGMKQQILSLAAGLALVLVLPLAEATAQWNNRPYQPAFRGAAGGVGMSPGYRQVIIQDRLSDRMSRNNLYRLPSGALADVAQDRDQAFIIGADGLPSVRTGR